MIWHGSFLTLLTGWRWGIAVLTFFARIWKSSYIQFGFNYIISLLQKCNKIFNVKMVDIDTKSIDICKPAIYINGIGSITFGISTIHHSMTLTEICIHAWFLLLISSINIDDFLFCCPTNRMLICCDLARSLLDIADRWTLRYLCIGLLCKVLKIMFINISGRFRSQ